MYRRAEKELGIDLSRSFYVGDRWRDVAVTEELGGTGFLVRTGYGGQDAPAEFERVDDLAAAATRIVALVSGQ
jgi:histidinol phosphatase-like enzyme